MSSSQQPPADERLFETDGLEADLFWERYRTPILAGAAAVIAAGFGVAAWFYNAHDSKLKAEAALATAGSPEEWRELISRFPKSQPAANAYFLLAESQREQGNIDESSATYAKFLAEFPKHELAGGARIGIAENLETAGKSAEALAALREVQSMNSGSYAAPFAALLEGRIFLRQGKLAEARKVFSTLVSTYPLSPASRVAGAQLEQLAVVMPADQVLGPAAGAPQ